MPIRFRSCVLSVALLFGCVSTASAEFAITAGAENFQWQEFTSAGRLLEESGHLFRAGAIWRERFAQEQMLLELRGSGYFGRVDYDGQACDVFGPSCTPYRSDADYRGIAAEATLARRFGRSTGADLFAGGGFDTWRRDIKGDSNTAGVVEDWTVMYLLAGGGGHWEYTSTRYEARAGFKYPFYARDTNHFYEVTVEPKGKPSFFARFSTDFMSAGRPRWGLTLYYDTYRFDQSNVQNVGFGLGVFQPRTEQDVIGLYALIYLP